MIDPPDPAEIMVAVWTHRGVGPVVHRPPGIIVNDGLVVEIADIKSAIGSNASFDRAEPHVAAPNEFRFARFVRAVANAVGFDDFMMDDVDGGFGSEVAVVPFRRPRAAIVNGAPGGSGE